MKRLAPLTFAIVILLAACSTGGSSRSGPSENSAGEKAGQISELNGIEQLRGMFNEGAGTPRLLLLMSPT